MRGEEQSQSANDGNQVFHEPAGFPSLFFWVDSVTCYGYQPASSNRRVTKYPLPQEYPIGVTKPRWPYNPEALPLKILEII